MRCFSSRIFVRRWCVIEEIIAFTIKILITFLFMFLLTRVLSKKAVSQLSPFEFIGIILLSDNIGVPISSHSLAGTIYSSFLLVGLIVLTGRLSMMPMFSDYLEEVPTVLMEKGKLDFNKLKQQYMPLNQLLALVRNQGYDSLEVIDAIILEPNGELSIFPKPEHKGVSVVNLDLPVDQPGFSVPVIIDGRFIAANLAHTEYTKEQICEKLSKDISDYLLVEVTKEHTLYTVER